MSHAIRLFTLADSDAIAVILADGWAQAYGGFMPAHVLAPRADHAGRKAEMLEFLRDEFDPQAEALLVAVREGQITGFVHVVLGDKGELGTGGYVSLLYVSAESQGSGLGRRLLAEGARWLAGKTNGTIAIAAFRDNPFHPFYAHLGGDLVKTADHVIDGFACQSVIYLWPDAETLARAATGAGGGT